MILFIKLLLAHLLGDFIFQHQDWVQDKEARKYKSPKLYLHGLIHFALVALLLTGQPNSFAIAAVIAISHIIIDLLKVQFQTATSRTLFFISDQILHLVVLILVTYFITMPVVELSTHLVNQLLIFTTGIVIILTPTSVLVKILLSKWAPATEIKTDKIETQSLQHAGMMIGYLERILVFIFILANQWAAIGFLVTAKSVFRFSDLKIGHDRKLTEYILIGTLSSFGIAIITALATVHLLKI